MESTNNGDSNKGQQEQSRPDSRVSTEIWKDLLHTEIIGNAMFPQSSFAQGILLLLDGTRNQLAQEFRFRRHGNFFWFWDFVLEQRSRLYRYKCY